MKCNEEVEERENHNTASEGIVSLIKPNLLAGKEGIINLTEPEPPAGEGTSLGIIDLMKGV